MARREVRGNRIRQRPKVFVMLGYGLDPDSWRRKRERGLAWDETPYGYDLATEFFDMQWARDAPESATARRIRQRLQRWLGFDWVHVWRNRKGILASDVIWTHTEREHLGVAALRVLHPWHRGVKVLAQTVWLWDEWDDWPRWRRALAARLLRTHEVEAVLSPLNRDKSQLTLPGRDVVLVPFGTADTGGEVEAPESSPATVIAPGNDRHRDWALLERVARTLPGVKFTVYSSSPAAIKRDWPSNVEVNSTSSVVDLARQYASAGAVALPLKANLHASGITVASEAMSAGAPLVVSDTGGIAPYVEADGCQLVPEGDVDAFSRALLSAIAADRRTVAASQRARRRVLGLTQADYVHRYCWLTYWLTGQAGLHPAVTTFASVPVPTGAGTTGSGQ